MLNPSKVTRKHSQRTATQTKNTEYKKKTERDAIQTGQLVGLFTTRTSSASVGEFLDFPALRNAGKRGGYLMRFFIFLPLSSPLAASVERDCCGCCCDAALTEAAVAVEDLVSLFRFVRPLVINLGFFNLSLKFTRCEWFSLLRRKNKKAQGSASNVLGYSWWCTRTHIHTKL